jgi:hypothetical protein
MANEILFSFRPGGTTYFLVFNRVGQVWRTDTNVFENYFSPNYANYAVSATQQGGSQFYEGNFPTQIGSGDYSVAAKQQLGGGAVESDPVIANGNYSWNGSAQQQLADIPASGLLNTLIPMRVGRGTMVKPFVFKMVSAADHVSAFVSGTISGQISKDGGAFAALQSGAFSEIGLGWYQVQALTSGDLLANTVAISFNGIGISGGNADQRDLLIITQRTSGQ